MEITAGMLILSEDKIVFYLLFKAEPCGMVLLFRVRSILITVCNQVPGGYGGKMSL